MASNGNTGGAATQPADPLQGGMQAATQGPQLNYDKINQIRASYGGGPLATAGKDPNYYPQFGNNQPVAFQGGQAILRDGTRLDNGLMGKEPGYTWNSGAPIPQTAPAVPTPQNQMTPYQRPQQPQPQPRGNPAGVGGNVGGMLPQGGGWGNQQSYLGANMPGFGFGQQAPMAMPWMTQGYGQQMPYWGMGYGGQQMRGGNPYLQFALAQMMMQRPYQ